MTIKTLIIQIRIKGIAILLNSKNSKGFNWIPKKIIKVDSIPSLASGKLDIKKCENLARS